MRGASLYNGMSMIWKILLPLFLLGQAAYAADGDFSARLQDWGKLFDGLRGKSMSEFIPSLPFPGQGGGIHHWKSPENNDGAKTVPGAQTSEIGESGPIGFDWLSYRDAFQGREHCATVDVVYVKQPSVDEALSSLNECLAEVSKAYGVQVAAVKGNDEILIVLTGVIPEGSTIAADLQHALAIRKNRLYLHPTRLQRIGSPAPTS